MNKKINSSYDEFIKSLSEKERSEFEKEYKEFLLSELIVALMNDNDMSVRKLAKAAGISPTIVQELRSGKKRNVTLQSFINILDSMGYSLVVEKPIKNSKKRSRLVLNTKDYLNFIEARK